MVTITGPARSGRTTQAATLPDQEAQRQVPPLRRTLSFTNQSTSGQHRIRTCDLYGVKPAYRPSTNREKVHLVRAKPTNTITAKRSQRATVADVGPFIG